MGKTRDPPPFSLDKPYQQWKTEIKAWRLTTDAAEKNKAALTIALSLPEKGANNIRQRIFNKVNFFVAGADANADETISPNAWKDVIAFMDKEFAKDDIAELYDKTDAFLHTVKKADETMKEYINRFDDAMSQAEKAGIGAISQGFQMCLFLKNAGLDEKDFKFVVSAIDYKKKDDLYPQAKESMIKYFGSICGKQEEDNMGIQNLDTLWSGSRGGFRRGGFKGRGGGSRGGHGGGNEELSVQSKYSGNIYGQPQPKQFRKLNPKKFGKILKCHNCQAVTHLAGECPEANVTLLGEMEDIDTILKMAEEEEHDDGEEDYVSQISKNINASTQHETHYSMCWAVTAIDPTEVMVQGSMVTENMKDLGVLDTGCICTVGAKKWMNQRLGAMPERTRKMVKVQPSGRVFRFGGGVTAKSMGLYTLPVSVGGINTFLNIDVVEAPIPLLISKAAMKKAGAVIDTRDDTLMIFDKKMPMVTVKAGHYAIVLDEYNHDNTEVAEVLEVKTEEEEEETKEKKEIWAENEEEREKQIKKVHEQLGHPNIKVFKRMIKTSAGFDKDIDMCINKLYEECVTCLKHGKGKVRPKVCTPLSQEVNSTVAMDLKIWPKYNAIILYITCLFSRFTHGVLIPDKKPESVIKAFMDGWVLGFFGIPKHGIMVDNGAEFHNPKFRSMCEKMNIKLLSSGSWSPWSNGIVERNHGVVDSIISRMKEDNPKAPMKELLRAALFTKNMMTNKEGFSSYQIVTGEQPRIPGVPYNDPPANETSTESEAVKGKMQAMFRAREEYMKVENDSRIKKALNSKIPAPKLEFYENGEEVWYRNGKEGIWQGPATVIGQQNKVIYIRQGRFILAASQTNLKKKNPEKEKRIMKELQKMVKERKEKKESKNNQDMKQDSDDSSDEEEGLTDSESEDQSEPVNEADADEVSQDGEPDAGETGSDRHSLGQAGATQPGTPPPPPEAARDSAGEESDSTRSLPQSPETASYEREFNREYHQVSPQLNKDPEPKPPEPFVFDEMPSVKLVKGDVVWARKRCERHDPKAWEKFTIKIRTHKKCRYGNTNYFGPHYNVTDINGQDMGWYPDTWDWHLEGHERPDRVVNYVEQDPEFENLAPHQVLEEDTYVVFIPPEQHHMQFVLDAKAKEIKNFKDYKAFEEVQDIGQERITMSWVITEKIYGNGEKGCKARLVAHGNRLDEPVPRDSPTARKNTLRIMMSLCVQYSWKIYNCDVTAAFLQSTFMMREVCVQPPKDVAKEGTLWRLLRPCYGLPEASLCWFLTVNQDLLDRGMKEVIMDPAAYYWREDGTLKGMYVGHVDDAYYCGDQDFHNKIMKPLFEKFKMGQIMEGDFRSLGWNVRTNFRGEIGVSQRDYIETKVERLPIQKERTQLLTDRLTEEQTSILRSAIGTLRWIADQTRPDVSAPCLILNTQQLAPTWREVKLFNATVDKVKRQPVEILYKKLEPSIWYVTVFCDASHNSICNGQGSVAAYLVFLSNGYEKGERRLCNILAWKSSKIKRVCKSTTEAETLSLSEAVEEADLIRDQIKEMTGLDDNLIRMEVFSDARNCVENLNNRIPPNGTRTYRNEFAMIKRLKDEKRIKNLAWVPGDEQMADSLTKLGASKVDLIETLNSGRFFN